MGLIKYYVIGKALGASTIWLVMDFLIIKIQLELYLL